MTTIQAIYFRLPNWVGDVCMSLPCLDALLATNSPVVVCARSWARDLLAAYPLAGFVAMKGNVRADCKAVRAHRKQAGHADRSEEHTSELQSLMRISYAVFCLKKKKKHIIKNIIKTHQIN